MYLVNITYFKSAYSTSSLAALVALLFLLHQHQRHHYISSATSTHLDTTNKKYLQFKTQTQPPHKAMSSQSSQPPDPPTSSSSPKMPKLSELIQNAELPVSSKFPHPLQIQPNPNQLTTLLPFPGTLQHPSQRIHLKNARHALHRLPQQQNLRRMPLQHLPNDATRRRAPRAPNRAPQIPNHLVPGTTFPHAHPRAVPVEQRRRSDGETGRAADRTREAQRCEGEDECGGGGVVEGDVEAGFEAEEACGR